MDNQRNFLLAAVLSLAVVFLWQAFVIQPRIDRERAIAESQAKLEKEKAASSESGQSTANNQV